MEPASTIPDCDPSETITQVDMEAAHAKGDLLRLHYVYLGEEGAFLKVVLKSEPDQELYLSTRRDRTHPRIFIDQNLLMADLKRRFGQVVSTIEIHSPSMDQAAPRRC